MRPGLAFVALLMVPMLAGCTDDARETLPPVVMGVPAAEVEAGRYYAFRHAGGALVFTLDDDGDASFDLYDGEDRRLGSVGFSSEPSRSGLHRIEGVSAGDVVLRLLTLNGTLRIESNGRGVGLFQPLLGSVERHLLVDRAPRSNPLGFLGPSDLPLVRDDPADESVAVALQRPPADLRVLATGPWSNLSVELRSERGVVLRTAPDPQVSPGFDVAPARSLTLVPAQITAQNIRTGMLTARIRADDLGGAVVLEAHSYSRSPLPSPGPPGPAVKDIAFTYGQLSDAPLAFIVHPETSRLLLWQEGPTAGNASVALFDAKDHKLAVVQVPSQGTVEVPVPAGGEYVAIALEGKVTLGADRAPADFELRPLEIAEVVTPRQVAGAGGRYALNVEDVPAATAYAFRPTTMSGRSDALDQPPNPLGGCPGGRFLRVDQDGEALLAVFEPDARASVDSAPFLSGAFALRSGPLTVTHDGFGDDGCDRAAVAILAYVRP